MTVTDLEEFEPIEITTKSRAEESGELKHIFSIDGRDYYVPTKVPFRVTLKAAKIFASGTAQQAEAYMMTQFLGDDAYNALCESSVEEEQFDKIVELASKVVLGKGKVRKASPSTSKRVRQK